MSGSLENGAVARLAWRALDGAASDDAIAHNTAAWRAHRIVPRAFRTRGETDLRTRLWGVDLDHPVLAAPVAIADAGLAGTSERVAEGAARTGGSVVLSASGHALADAVSGHLPDGWFAQVYLPDDRERIRGRLQELRGLGAAAAFLTVDQLSIPFQQPFRAWARELAPSEPSPLGPPAASIGLDDIGFVAEASGLPVVVKGILHPDDAVDAVGAGAAGIVVSNHGGRQIAGSVAAAQQLPLVADAVGGRVPVLADSGIREARDVVVALALGADAVLIGRPLVAAAWRGGADGVARALGGLIAELRGALTLAGVADLAHLDASLVRHAGAAPSLPERKR